MIIKKGNKTDRTAMMENAIYDYFHNTLGIRLEHEVYVSTGIVDFLGFIKEEDEIMDVIAIEIKQSSADFHSGCGLNFVGVSNYVAVPSELVGYAIEFLRNNYRNYVGVLEVHHTGMVRLVIPPMAYLHNDFVRICVGTITPYHIISPFQKVRQNNRNAR